MCPLVKRGFHDNKAEKTNLLLPGKLKTLALYQAKLEGLSMSQLVRKLLENYLAEAVKTEKIKM